MHHQQQKEILQKIADGSISPEERQAFDLWLDSLDKEQLASTMDLFHTLLKASHMEGSVDQELFRKIEHRLDDWERQDAGRVINLPLWKKFAAAAAIIIVVVTAGLVYLRSSDKKSEQASAAPINQKKSDVHPGGNKAVLTLADGSVIILDDVQNGSLAVQGQTQVIKLDGKLNYQQGTSQPGEIVYNTISTPRGGQYQVVLPDGSKVWLNAASSLRFPTAFVHKERKIEISGEAYLEVAHNNQVPFIVSVRGADIKVLGTHFNVMAYSDEATMKTTLLEGSVQFIAGTNIATLKPGQQSQLTEDGVLRVVHGVNMEDVVAWKNGNFHFEGVDLGTITRQLARWYDVEIIFQETGTAESLHAEFPRDTKLSDALRVLELAGTARFEISGNKVIVK